MEHSEDIRKREDRFRLMTETPVPRLVMRMAVPTVISMSVSAIYNFADSFFVGHISTEATAGVGIAFAYQCLVQAAGFFFGAGSGNYISRSLGAQDSVGAEKMASTGFFSAFITGLVLMTLGLLFLTPLSIMLGAVPEVIPASNAYMKWLLVSTPFLVSQMTMNNQLRLQGNATLSMIGLIAGAVLNIALDPILIYSCGMGVAGASLSTAISQFVSWLILFWMTTRNGIVHILPRNFTPRLYMYREIAAGGFPSLMRQSLGCISTICLNWAVAYYAVPGQEASTIAAFSVVSRVMMCAMCVILGIGQGFQPVCGFNWGAGLRRRVRSAYLFTMSFSTALILVMSLLGLAFAPQIIAFFRSEDPQLIDIGTVVLRWQCLMFPLVGVTTPTNMLFQNIRMTAKATVLAMSRQGIFFFPLLILLPRLFGLPGLQAVMAFSDLCTFFLALPFCISILRELDAE